MPHGNVLSPPSVMCGCGRNQTSHQQGSLHIFEASTLCSVNVLPELDGQKMVAEEAWRIIWVAMVSVFCEAGNADGAYPQNVGLFGGQMQCQPKYICSSHPYPEVDNQGLAVKWNRPSPPRVLGGLVHSWCRCREQNSFLGCTR